MSKRIAILATVPDDTDPSEVLDQMAVAIHDCFPMSEADRYGELHDLAVIDNYEEDDE